MHTWAQKGACWTLELNGHPPSCGAWFGAEVKILGSNSCSCQFFKEENYCPPFHLNLLAPARRPWVISNLSFERSWGNH